MLFTTTTGAGPATSSGYALEASATVTGTAGPLSASATLQIQVNKTSSAQNVEVPAGPTNVQVNVPIIPGGVQITLLNANVNIKYSDGSPLIQINAGSTSQVNPPPSGDSSETSLTNVSLFLLTDGGGSKGSTLLSISATSATDEVLTGGGHTITLTGVSLAFGSYVTFTAQQIVVQYSNNGGLSLTFAFTNAAIAFSINSQQMLSVGGSVSFSYSTTNGLELIGTPSFTNFSFMGQPLVGGPQQLADNPVTLGPVTLTTLPSVSFSNFNFSLSGQLSVTVSITGAAGTLNTSSVTASVSGLGGSFTIGATINLSDPLSVPSNINVGGFSLTVGTFTIDIGGGSSPWLVLSGTNITIDPTAGSNADFVSFGGNGATAGLSATLSVAGLSFTGSFSNLAITGDGTFVPGQNFQISFSMTGGSQGSGNVGVPLWLPIQITALSAVWPNFQADPTNFNLTISASVNATLGPLTLGGSVTGLVINVHDLVTGSFLIVGLQSASITIGAAFSAVTSPAY